MEFIKDIHYSQNFETAILGACMLDSGAFSRVYSNLDEENFYFSAHQNVFKTIKSMFENGIPVDIYTVIDQIKRVQGISTILDYNVDHFITSLTNSVVSSAHMEFHAYIVKTMWIEREIMKLTNGSVKLEGNVRQKIGELQLKLSELNKKNTESDWQDMTELMVNLYKHQVDQGKAGGMGVTTGINRLDRLNGGFQPGNMIVIGARPSMGKSAFIGQVAIAMAKTGKKVGIISLEMSNNEIAARLASLDSDTDFNIVFRGLYADENQKHKLYSAISKSTSQLPIFITDKTGVNINEIRAKASTLQNKQGLDCLMIDYLQLISAEESRNRNREQEVSKISQGIKIMAKEMNIPVIVLAQLNREVTRRKNESRYPELADLRESGSLEQDADCVMFIHRDFMAGIQTHEDGSSTEREADLVVKKWRNSQNNFIVKLDFDPPKMRFTERKDSNWIPVATPKNFYEKDEEPF